MTTKELRVAAVVVTPPTFKASGGVSAGIQLSQRVATLVDCKLFLMAENDCETFEESLSITRQKARNPLLRFRKLLPQQALNLAWRPDIKSWLQKGGFDIVHLHNPHPPGALENVARACTELQIPYVISTHGFVEFNEFSRGFGAPAWQKPLLEMLVRKPVLRVAQKAARVFMLSPQEQPMLTNMGVPKSRLRVVTNGVDPYFASVIAETERRRLTARFGLPIGRPLVLYVGNHTANKGLDVLLRAIPLMRQDAVVVVAGAIRSQQEHSRLLADNGMSAADSRLLFTDFITREELRALYQTADVFVFPSRADTLPLVILEAMASGLPVVSTLVGGIPYEVSAETGMLMEPGEPAPLAAALDSLCADEAVRRSMGAAGRKRAMQMFRWETSAEAAVEIYREIQSELGALAPRR
jgi:glycosyltransferase involved in cell wall biosynthesis